MTVDRAVEVLHDRGPQVRPRWQVGSGFLLAPGLVLTAAHNVSRTGGLSVRFQDRRERPALLLRSAAPRLDLALLQVDGSAEPGDLGRPPFAALDRTSADLVGDCWAVGFPRFKVTGGVRETAHVHGEIPPGANRIGGLVQFRVRDSPRPIPGGNLAESEWAGMSGAVVFARHPRLGDHVIGVVAEHHLAEGESSLTVVPITAVAELGAEEAEAWSGVLGLGDPRELAVLPVPPAPARAVTRPAGHVALLRRLADFTDRSDALSAIMEIARAQGEADPSQIVVLYGMGGVGKTTLANQAAHLAAPFYGHARVHLDLGPAEDDAYLQFFRKIGLSDEEVPRSGRGLAYQAALRRGRCLLVLDNAVSAEQVESLLPYGDGCLTLVTSRSVLAGVDGARRIMVAPMSDADSLVLLERIVGADRLDADPEAARAVARQLAGLPLATRIVGTRMVLPRHARLPLGQLADQLKLGLRSSGARLNEFEDGQRGVGSSLAVSYAGLPPDTARAFRLLAVLPLADYGPDAAGAALGVSAAEADGHLGTLVDAQLMMVRDRFVFHDLVRAFAREMAELDDPPEAAAEAFARCARWYADTAVALRADWPEDQADPAAMAWLSAERVNALAVLRQAHHDGLWRDTHRLAWALRDMLKYRGLLADADDALALAVDAAREDGDAQAEVHLLVHLALVRRERGRFDGVADLYDRALAGAAARGDQEAELWTLVHYGDYLCDRDRQEDALVQYARARAIHQANGDAHAEIWVIAHMADAYRGMGRHTEAIEVSMAGLELSVALGDQNQVAWTLLHLGLAYGGAGQFAQGTSALTRALDHQRLIGNTAGQVTLLHHLARLHLSAGDLASARTAAGEGLTLAQGIGNPDLLNSLRATLADIG
ncbi:NB-ARC domain-containing protein [Herbidospora sp. NBRC 101105]|uniref:NB-ARC domain-containing protein n=1 Tax=Herbidospora sp. NBRC 101105 TaxID=3032195 RepID=UPI0025563BB8|nr:NB-ARC domain-containing protein [Herbidospora sp. NBRC 101105]